jgi:hypothetical protein
MDAAAIDAGKLAIISGAPLSQRQRGKARG